MACTQIEKIIDKFSVFTEKPVNYLVVQDELKDDIKHFVKSLYDFTKSKEEEGKKVKKNALPKLIVQDFDEEQIWQEIELQNSECWDKLVWEVSNCISSKNDLLFPVDVQQQPEHEETGELGENTVSSGEESSHDEVESKAKKPTKSKSKNNSKGSIVDDKFFKLKDMEKFLLNEEKKESGKVTSKKDKSDSEDESIDLFEDDDGEQGDENDKDVMYSDFFDGIGDEDDETDVLNGNDENEQEKSISKLDHKKKVKFAGLSSSDDESDNSEENDSNKNNETNTIDKKSDFEERQQRLQQTITRLEEKSLKEAPWQLKGEVVASKRPQNSLLEEVVDFDLTSRPPPLITEQTTMTLEDIIKRRIKDKAWDDVERKEKPVDDQLSFRKTEILDQSKSKLSLAQVYEAEYLKQKQALSGDVDEEKEPEINTEIRDSMSKLFAKLDALCHYHYTPKAPQAEVKIVTNTPAISMEEVAPVATSDAALLAPEEVKKKNRGDLMSKEERTQTDKNRERRKKKKLQKLKGKVTKVTEHRNTKQGVEANDKSLKTSKAFFQQLNDETTSLIKSKKVKNVKNTRQ